MEKPYSWALYHLNWARFQVDGLSELQVLRLAVKHSIHPWVDKSVRLALRLGAATLRAKTQEMLRDGMPTHIISILKDRASEIADIYHWCASAPPSICYPPVHSPPHDHMICRVQWRQFWLHVVGPKLRHRTNRVELVDLGEFLENEPIPSMPKACRDLAVSKVQEHVVRYHELNVVDKAIEQIQDCLPVHHYSTIDKSVIRC